MKVVVKIAERTGDFLGLSRASVDGLRRFVVTAAWFGVAAALDWAMGNVASIGLPEYWTPVVGALLAGASKWVRSRKAES